MKKTMVLLAAISFFVAGAAENLIVNPAGEKNFGGWWRSKPAAFVAMPDGFLQIHGLEDAAAKKYFKAQQRIQIPAAKIPGTKFLLSAKMRTPKITGKFKLSVREAIGKDSSRYNALQQIDKWNKPAEWTEFKKEFTADKKTIELSLYTECHFFDPADKVEIKDLKLEIVK